MRRITLWTMSTLSALVLLFSYHTSTNRTAAPLPLVSPRSSSTNASADGAPTGTASSSSSNSGRPSSSTAAASKTYTGDAIQMQYGPVQVKVTVANGKVTAVQAVDYPMSTGREQEINSVAIPTLDSEATTARTAGIDMVSGATFTSQAYIQSLQSALDQAAL